MKKNTYYIFEINGEKYLSLEQVIKEKLLHVNLNGRNYKLTVEDKEEKSIKFYWELAAKENMREKFMNTVRPLLKEKLGYSYSEIICEEKSKLLCKRYYEYHEKGKEYKGPYLIE